MWSMSVSVVSNFRNTRGAEAEAAQARQNRQRETEPSVFLDETFNMQSAGESDATQFENEYQNRMLNGGGRRRNAPTPNDSRARVSNSSNTSRSSTSTASHPAPQPQLNKIKNKNNSTTKPKPKTFIPPKNWAEAPEFVPKFFASETTTPTKATTAINSGHYSNDYSQVSGSNERFSNGPFYSCDNRRNAVICRYAITGDCHYGNSCSYPHGHRCDFCKLLCLHPFDPDQRRDHTQECQKKHEREASMKRSKDKTCGICMEVIMEKTPKSEQRFGILPSCGHCYCVSCIRKWRRARNFKEEVTRACPECRVTSDYVCPSEFWEDDKQGKDKILENYKNCLSKKACKYYQNGKGKCPFGNKCFYLHALRNGTKVDVGPPPPRRQRRVVDVDEDPFEDGVRNFIVYLTHESLPEYWHSQIWEFLQRWEADWEQEMSFDVFLRLMADAHITSDDSDDEYDVMSDGLAGFEYTDSDSD